LFAALSCALDLFEDVTNLVQRPVHQLVEALVRQVHQNVSVSVDRVGTLAALGPRVTRAVLGEVLEHHTLPRVMSGTRTWVGSFVIAERRQAVGTLRSRVIGGSTATTAALVTTATLSRPAADD
jgi:hypothetical protein